MTSSPLQVPLTQPRACADTQTWSPEACRWTVKAGQKCTAIRRIFVPADGADAVADALSEKLKATKVGDPRQADTRMGPLVTRVQQAAAFDGIRRLAAEAAILCGGAEAPALDGIDKSKSAFVAPTLLRLRNKIGRAHV